MPGTVLDVCLERKLISLNPKETEDSGTQLGRMGWTLADPKTIKL